MQYQGLAVLLALVALLVVVVAVRGGYRLDWLLGWLKGWVLSLLLGVGLVLGLAAWELQQFRPLQADLPIAVMEFRELGPQQFEVTLTLAGEEQEHRIMLQGDLWQLDVQVLRWIGLGEALGLEEGYRLNQLTGRYLAFEQQRNVPEGLTRPLNTTPGWRDLWSWVDRQRAPVLLEADAFVLRFMPLANQARFAVEIAPTGLTPVPLNPAAVEALKRLR
jgi:hypothetical protein